MLTVTRADTRDVRLRRLLFEANDVTAAMIGLLAYQRNVKSLLSESRRPSNAQSRLSVISRLARYNNSNSQEAPKVSGGSLYPKLKSSSEQTIHTFQGADVARRDSKSELSVPVFGDIPQSDMMNLRMASEKDTSTEAVSDER